MNSPVLRPHEKNLNTVRGYLDQIKSYARLVSPMLTEACKEAGLNSPVADVCAGVLASVIEDLIAVSRLNRSDFERTKRKERVLAAAQEPVASALRLAIAASPVNGRAAVAHWDVVCEHHEVGKLAWLLGMPTETAKKYSVKYGRRG
jgi:hypothetical protein